MYNYTINKRETGNPEKRALKSKLMVKFRFYTPVGAGSILSNKNRHLKN